MPAKLTVTRGPNVNEAYPLDDTRTVILGRSSKADIHLADSRASRQHCSISRDEKGWTARDLDSTNGTYVNRQRITHVTLVPGDVIRIGNTVYKFTEEVGSGPDPDGTRVISEQPAPGSARTRPDEEPAQRPAEGPPSCSHGESFGPAARREALDGPTLKLALPDAEEPVAQGRKPPACAQCGRQLSENALSDGDATDIGGRLFCSRCVVRHSDTPSAKQEDTHDASESSQFSSLLKSIERATQADRVDGGPPAAGEQESPQPKRKRSLFDRLFRRPPK